MKDEQKRKIVRSILSVYFNAKGFLNYLVYFWHPFYNNRTFYCKKLGKYFLHREKQLFRSRYQITFAGYVTHFKETDITLTFKDLGLYDLKLVKEYGK